MTTAYEIPLQPNAQTFTIPLAGVTYDMTLHWCDSNQTWVLDIADANGDALVQGIPLVTGADLLAQYGYLGFGGALECQTDDDSYAVPTYGNLGQTSHLYFLTNP
ncbi:MAG: phage baseplate plug protein [Rhodomicrobium sp.]